MPFASNDSDTRTPITIIALKNSRFRTWDTDIKGFSQNHMFLSLCVSPNKD